MISLLEGKQMDTDTVYSILIHIYLNMCTLKLGYEIVKAVKRLWLISLTCHLKSSKNQLVLILQYFISLPTVSGAQGQIHYLCNFAKSVKFLSTGIRIHYDPLPPFTSPIKPAGHVPTSGNV